MTLNMKRKICILFFMCAFGYQLFWIHYFKSDDNIKTKVAEDFRLLERNPAVRDVPTPAASTSKEENFILEVHKRITEDAEVRRNVFLSRNKCPEGGISARLPLSQSCALKLTVNELAEASRNFDYLNQRLQKGWMEAASVQRFESYEKKLILIWDLDTADYAPRICPNCYITGNKSFANPGSVDAIILNSFRLLKALRAEDQAAIPTREMFPNAKMIAYEYEPTQRSSSAKLGGHADYTFGYRRDSDVAKSNGYIIPRRQPVRMEEVLAKNARKTRMAAWLVSNCGAPSKRIELAKSLQSHGVQVDIYGGCGTFHCEKKNKSCQEILGQNYKFYFSFENTLCNHYVTEKFYRSLMYNMIPITYGLGHEFTGAPIDSYIDVFDFPDTKSLAEYILYLDSNITAYNEYFKWNEYYEVDYQTRHHFKLCQWCQMLAEDTPPAHKFGDGEYEAWVKEGQCIDVKNNTRIWNFVHDLPQE